MNTTKKQAAAVAPQVGSRVGLWQITDRVITWDKEDEGWSLEVWATDQDGNESKTRVVILEPMLSDPKAAAYLEVILEEALSADQAV